MKSSGVVVVALLFSAAAEVLLAAPRVDQREARRFVGREDDVRVDAQLIARHMKPNGPVQVVLEIQNDRSESIAFDPNIAVSDYDEQTRTITITVGAEIPDPKKPMRLQVIRSGEKRIFQAAARLMVPTAVLSSVAPRPRMVQVKINYLSDVAPFSHLVDRSSPADASLFATWIDHNVAVVTNSVPFDFTSGGHGSELVDASRRSLRGSF